MEREMRRDKLTEETWSELMRSDIEYHIMSKSNTVMSRQSTEMRLSSTTCHSSIHSHLDNKPQI